MSAAEAQRLLDEHNTRNRSVRPRVVEEYTRSILQGRWQDHYLNKCSIGTDGVLIDGQHRLIAIAASKTAVPFGVERNVDPSIADIIDRGSPRRVDDLPALAHIPNKSQVASVARVLLGEHEGFALYDYTGPSRFSHQEVGDYIIKHEDEIVFAQTLVHHGRPLRVQRKALAIFTVRAMRKHPEVGLADFLTDLGTGADLAMGDPRLAARQWFIRYGSDGKSPDRKWESHYSILVKAFNSWMKGETESKYFKAWDRNQPNAGGNFPDIE
jgi:hypothetical protein|tara:strand:+ start:2982 stop:3788 length:807 start_codon:yes stop_codon:yes gene_type:complete